MVGAVPPPPTRATKDADVAAPPRRPLPLMSAHLRRRPAAADTRPEHLCAPIVGADPARVGGGVSIGGGGGTGAAAPSRRTWAAQWRAAPSWYRRRPPHLAS